MGWVDSLDGQLIALDTGPLIYFIERHPRYLPVVRPFFQSLSSGRLRVVTANVTLLEVLVHPYRQGNSALRQQYQDILLHAAGVRLMALSHSIADGAARLRGRHGLLTPDAIQLATALSTGATAFLTNDRHFPTLSNLTTLVVDDLV